jgi:phosphate starvation-inducible membrane PsiE
LLGVSYVEELGVNSFWQSRVPAIIAWAVLVLLTVASGMNWGLLATAIMATAAWMTYATIAQVRYVFEHGQNQKPYQIVVRLVATLLFNAAAVGTAALMIAYLPNSLHLSPLAFGLFSGLLAGLSGLAAAMGSHIGWNALMRALDRPDLMMTKANRRATILPGPEQSELLDSIVGRIWETNVMGHPLRGIDIREYPKKYGEYGIYYLIRDIRKAYEYQDEISSRHFVERLNRITGENGFKSQHLPAERFFVLKDIMTNIHQQGELGRYAGLAGLPALIERFQSELTQRELDDSNIDLGDITRLLATPDKLRLLIGAPKDDAEVNQWNMKMVNLSLEKFSLIRKWLAEKYEQGTLAAIGKANLRGLVDLIDEIQQPAGPYAGLQNINIRQLTSLLASAQNVAALLGPKISSKDPKIGQWKWNVVDLNWDHFTALIEIMRQKYARDTLANYGAKDGSGLVLLLEEIRTSGSPYESLRGVHIGQMTKLLNSVEKLSGILRTTPADPRLKGWDMPVVPGHQQYHPPKI